MSVSVSRVRVVSSLRLIFSTCTLRGSFGGSVCSRLSDRFSERSRRSLRKASRCICGLVMRL